MMSRPVTEDNLQSYVDNRLDSKRHGEVADFLLTNDEAARRVAAYRDHAATLRSALDPVIREPVPSRLNLAAMAQARRPRPRFPTARMAAAAIIFLAIGASGGWLMRSYSLPAAEGVAALAQEASATYSVFAPDQAHPVEVRADGTDALRQLATAALGTTTVIPELTAAGYRLMGGRVVPTAHGPALMLMYDDDKGSRVVMLTRHMLVDQDKPMISSERGAVAGWSWTKKGMGYSVVGSLPSDKLHPIADAMRVQI
jgi:anti-sigma factor RsiW